MASELWVQSTTATARLTVTSLGYHEQSRRHRDGVALHRGGLCVPRAGS